MKSLFYLPQAVYIYRSVSCYPERSNLTEIEEAMRKEMEDAVIASNFERTICQQKALSYLTRPSISEKKNIALPSNLYNIVSDYSCVHEVLQSSN